MKDTTSDRLLLEKVRNADVAAFQVLFERYQPMVFRNVFFLTHQSDFSHDIVQETFLRVWEHRETLKPDLSFLAYVLRISGNLVRDHFRHLKTRERVETLLPPPPSSEGDNPEESLRLIMLERKLNEIISRKLPERCRAIFLLSRFEEKSHREIADLFGLSVRTVENQINHALKVLRKNLKGYI